MKACLAALMAALCCAMSASAQTPIKPLERPDPAGLSVPDMTFKPSPSDIRRYDTYFYFQKSGVSYERAFVDLDQCRQNGAASKLVAVPPTFVPLGGDLVRDPTVPTDRYPPPGILVMYLIQEAEEDNTRATMRMCMTYKGYSRYGTSRALYKQIDSGTDAEKLGRQALIASAPPPQAEALAP